MGFKRALLPPAAPASDELTANMVGIGMLFGGAGSASPNIEDTLFHASAAGMDGEDFRVLSVLCTWLDVHSRWINADRLVAIVSAQRSKRVRAFWAAFGRWKGATAASIGSTHFIVGLASISSRPARSSSFAGSGKTHVLPVARFASMRAHCAIGRQTS